MLQKILEYQKIDMEKFKMEKEIEENKDRIAVLKLQQNIKSIESTLIKMDKDVAEYKTFLKKLSDKISECSKKVTELVNRAEIAEKQDEFDDIMVNADKVMEIVLSYEKEADALKKKLDSLNKTYKELKNQYVENLGYHSEAKNKFNVYKKSIEPKAVELIKRLDAASKDLSGDLFEKYKRLRNNKIMPAIVKLLGDSQCGGCFMELSVDCKTKLNANKIVECENCGRLIYID